MKKNMIAIAVSVLCMSLVSIRALCASGYVSDDFSNGNWTINNQSSSRNYTTDINGPDGVPGVMQMTLNGSHALKSTAPGGKAISFETGKTYDISVDFMAADATSASNLNKALNFYFRHNSGNTGTKYNHYIAQKPSTSWQNGHIKYTHVGDDCEITDIMILTSLTSGTSATLYLDNFCIREVGEDVYEDFETGVNNFSSPNTANGTVAIGADCGLNNSDALKVTAKFTTFTPVFSGFRFDVGKTYRISLWVRGEADTQHGQFSLWLKDYAHTTALPATGASTTSTETHLRDIPRTKNITPVGVGMNGTWQNFIFDYTPESEPEGYAYTNIFPIFDYDLTKSKVEFDTPLVYYIDDFSIKELEISPINWADDDLIKSESGDLVLPLQTPKITYFWSNDTQAENHESSTGDVYKQTINVSKAKASSKAASITDYIFTEGNYRLSMWFKEDQSNPAPFTRSWRPEIPDAGYSLLMNSNGSYFYIATAHANAAKKGEWTQVVMDFTVDESNIAALNSSGFNIKWLGRGSDGYDFDYNSSLNGDYTIYISDITLTKYPDKSTKTVVLPNNELSVSEGGNIVASANGLPDISMPAQLTIGDNTFYAPAHNIQKDGNYFTADYTFNTSHMLNGVYDAQIVFNDSWGTKIKIPCTIKIVSDIDYDISLTNATATAIITNNTADTINFSGVLVIAGYDENNYLSGLNFAPISQEIASEASLSASTSTIDDAAKYRAYIIDSFDNLNMLTSIKEIDTGRIEK